MGSRRKCNQNFPDVREKIDKQVMDDINFWQTAAYQHYQQAQYVEKNHDKHFTIYKKCDAILIALCDYQETRQRLYHYLSEENDHEHEHVSDLG